MLSLGDSLCFLRPNPFRPIPAGRAPYLTRVESPRLQPVRPVFQTSDMLPTAHVAKKAGKYLRFVVEVFVIGWILAIQHIAHVRRAALLNRQVQQLEAKVATLRLNDRTRTAALAAETARAEKLEAQKVAANPVRVSAPVTHIAAVKRVRQLRKPT